MRSRGVVATLWRIADARSRSILIRVLLWRAAQSFCAGLPVLGAVLIASALVGGGVSSSLATGVSALCVISLAGHWVCAIRANAIGWTGAMRIVAQIRTDALEHLRTLPSTRRSSSRAGDVLSTLTSDTAVLESYLVITLPNLAGAVSFPVIAGISLLFFQPVLAAAVIVSVLAALPLWAWAMARFGQVARDRQDAQAATTSAVLEYLHGMQVLRAFAGVPSGIARVRSAVEHSRALHTRLATRLTPPMLVFSAVLELGLPLLLLTMAWIEPLASVGILFGIVVLRVYLPILGAANEAETLRLARASLDRINAIMQERPLPRAADSHRPDGHGIELDAVSLQYGGGGPLALENVTLRAEQGTVTALVGPSGAGKSSILRAVARTCDVTAGSVRIGGVDVREIGAERLWDLTAVVLQESQLFSGSIADNIAISRPEATAAEIESAARAASVHDFVEGLPQGYAAQVGENGAALSGGQRQRICIARAFLKDSPILLLDEYSSSLDPSTEAVIRAALERLKEGRTVLVVGHRLSTFRGADQIAYLEEGRVLESGTHDELVAAGGRYAAMWRDRTAAQRWRVDNSAAMAPDAAPG